ncbi:hypothetical protein [Mycobacterium sp.]|uniref:hypothetical protein n=1 Tax=Mycobacterium sp. TaxID=1785 RepID=UPI003BB50095
MTVTVTLRDGDTDEYMRYGDTYTKHDDGTLDVVRDGAEQSYSYAPGVDQRAGRRKAIESARLPGFIQTGSHGCPADLEPLAGRNPTHTGIVDDGKWLRADNRARVLKISLSGRLPAATD